MKFTNDNGVLIIKYQTETVRIEAWGKDSLRVRSTHYPELTYKDNALTEAVDKKAEIVINGDESAVVTNGKISVKSNAFGVLTFYKDGKKILREHYRNYGGTESKEGYALKLKAREFAPILGGDYKLTVRFEANDGEKIYGMGQYPHHYLELKGCVLELAQKNTQVSIPFEVSSFGYGFLWNNPATGKVTFGKNYTEWIADCSKDMDYWITAGDTPAEILKNYTAVTGRAPMIPDNLLGLWQCKLRYQTQEEVLTVARKYKELNIPIDVIVIDFFHWPYQGDWCFDKDYFPDPKAMCDELHSMGIKVMVSVWPSVDRKSSHFNEMVEKGYLARTEKGAMQTYDYMGDCVSIDVTNPDAREYLWEICKKNYYDYGIDMFWLDNAEPDSSAYDFDNMRYYMGPASACGCIYPQMYVKAFNDGITAAGGKKNMIHLTRSGWAGNQKYPALIWSGDIPSTFESFIVQTKAGLNMGLAGIPWWTTDIGGFTTDDVNDPDFRELLLRWYEWAVFTPILRMHGDRGPYNIPNLSDLDYGGGCQHTGQDNELWSYGEEAFEIMKKNLDLRHELKPYIESLFKEASENGSPIIRTMFFEFPENSKCWEIEDQYMFGSKYLVAPIVNLGDREREVYLPEGIWKDIHTEEKYEGNTVIVAKAPIEYIPVFEKI